CALEPTPSTSQEGSNTGWPVPLLGGVRGGLIGTRFMGRGTGAPISRSAETGIPCAPGRTGVRYVFTVASSVAVEALPYRVEVASAFAVRQLASLLELLYVGESQIEARVADGMLGLSL